MDVTMNDPEIPLPRPTADGGGDGGGGASGEDGDKFNNLPADVTNHIISFLDKDVNVIDVIRTSIVARSWRYLWTSMTCLNFEIKHPAWSNPPDWMPSAQNYARYKSFVNWVLMSQDSSIRVERSRLFYLNYVDDYTVHRWINVLSRRKVKRLNLEVGLVSSPVHLPHSLLTCNSLLSLTLQFRPPGPGVLHLPTFAPFSGLEVLILYNIVFWDSVMLGNFISSCRRLKNLLMVACGFLEFEILDIRSSTLKTLMITNEWNYEYSLIGCEVKVACPSLVRVSFAVQRSALDITFQETNCLREAEIFLHYPSSATLEHYRTLMTKIVEQLYNVEKFTLTMPFYQFLNSMPTAEPHHFVTVFNNLKCLRVFLGMNRWYMQSIINMLNCSPILETLEVDFNTLAVGLDPWNIPNDAISYLTNNLKTVKINEFENVVNEVEFVRFLLEREQKLQKMSITWMRDIDRSDEIEHQINELPAASSSLEVTFY